MTTRALVAPDSFKGTLSASEVGAALAAGLERGGWDVDRTALADGGEGTAATLAQELGGHRVAERVRDPLGRTVEAAYWLMADATAVLDTAEASGLSLLEGEPLRPHRASTYGTGELIAAAAREARTVLVGVGGSATTDGGAGAIDAIERRGGLGPARVVCLCDVVTPWESAAAVFGPQKGASAEDVALLERRLDELASALPRDPRGVPATGAAGGLAGGLWARFGAQLCPGAAYVCDALSIDSRIESADLVVGGEGRLDRTTLEGKAMAELGRRCAEAQKPFVAIVGTDNSTEAERQAIGIQQTFEAGHPAEIEVVAYRLAMDAGEGRG